MCSTFFFSVSLIFFSVLRRHPPIRIHSRWPYAQPLGDYLIHPFGTCVDGWVRSAGNKLEGAVARMIERHDGRSDRTHVCWITAAANAVALTVMCLMYGGRRSVGHTAVLMTPTAELIFGLSNAN